MGEYQKSRVLITSVALDQVKDHVEFLYLKVDFWHNSEPVPVDLHIPKMKKLKEFQNSALNWLSCGDKLQAICTARIPTLQTLRLSTSSTAKSLACLLRNVMKEKDLFSGVKNLHVTNLHDPEVIAGLKTPFPNLESLSIVQTDMDSCQVIEMEPYLRAFGSLGLEFLEIDLGAFFHGAKLSEFLKGFSNCGELLSGTRKTIITYVRCAMAAGKRGDLHMVG